MGSRVMSPASNKAVPSSEGMRAVASPPPWPHGRQRGQPAPRPFPSKAPPRPGGSETQGRSPPPHTRSPHLPAKVGSILARPRQRRGGSPLGVRSRCPVALHRRRAVEREAGLPRPPGDRGSPRALPAHCGDVPGRCSAAY